MQPAHQLAAPAFYVGQVLVGEVGVFLLELVFNDGPLAFQVQAAALGSAGHQGFEPMGRLADRGFQLT